MYLLLIITPFVLSSTVLNSQSIEFPLVLDESVQDQPIFTDKMWVSELHFDGDTLRVASLLSSNGNALVFSDANNDGTYDNYVELDSPVGLGRKSWIIAVDFENSLVVLSPTDETPVVVGWRAPSLNGQIWNTDSYFDLSENRDKVIFLVFCYENCEGCQTISASLLELLEEFNGDSRVELLSIVTSENGAVANNRSITQGWKHLVSSTAWQDFRVTPTPTIIIIGGDGIIKYRRVGGYPDIGEELSKTIHKLIEQIDKNK